MKVTIGLKSIDSWHVTRRSFKTIEGARRYAHRYAMSDGACKITVSGDATLEQIFPSDTRPVFVQGTRLFSTW